MKNLPVLILLLILGCSESSDIIIQRELVRGGNNNCYLVFDPESKEAAIVDAGDVLNEIPEMIYENKLELK